MHLDDIRITPLMEGDTQVIFPPPSRKCLSSINMRQCLKILLVISRLWLSVAGTDVGSKRQYTGSHPRHGCGPEIKKI